MIRRWMLRLVKHVDGFLLTLICAQIMLGLIVLYSASGQSLDRVSDQLLNVAVALAVMWAVANVPPQHLMRLAVPMYAVGLILLIGVALFGEISHGARRWLHIGVTRIQPSELMKIAMPLMLAWYFDKYEGALRLRDFGVAAVLLAVPVALIVKQPDLGTALLISASGAILKRLARCA